MRNKSTGTICNKQKAFLCSFYNTENVNSTCQQIQCASFYQNMDFLRNVGLINENIDK